MPTYLEEFAFFADSLVVKTSQEALLGQLAPEDLAKQWADYLTKAQQKFLGEDAADVVAAHRSHLPCGWGRRVPRRTDDSRIEPQSRPQFRSSGISARLAAAPRGRDASPISTPRRRSS